MTSEEGKINWHLGFQGGMELELLPWKKDLEFEQEKELSKESLWMDLLITKKSENLHMEHPIGRLMRKFSAFEYKSPEDALSINDFSKAVGCAFLCAGLGKTVGEIPLDELSIFILRDSYPRELMKELHRLGLTIEEGTAGIYEVKPGLGATIHIVVTKRMEKGDCPVLSLLRSNADIGQAADFIRMSDQLSEPGDVENARAVLNIVFAANPKIVEWIRGNSLMYDALRAAIQPLLDESKEQGIDEANKKTVGNMVRLSFPLDVIMKCTGLQEADVLHIADSMGLAVSRA